MTRKPHYEAMAGWRNWQYAPDLKSGDWRQSFGFKSRARYQLSFVRDIKACEPPKVESTQCDLIEKARLGLIYVPVKSIYP